VQVDCQVDCIRLFSVFKCAINFAHFIQGLHQKRKTAAMFGLENAA